MDPIFPLGSEEKQTVWQKIIALSLKIKLALLFVVVIILGGMATVFIVWQNMQPPTLPVVGSPAPEQTPAENTDSSAVEPNPDNPKTDEQKKQETAINNKPSSNQQAATPNTSGGGTGNPGGSTPPPSGSVRPNSSNTGPNATLTSTYNGPSSNGNSSQTFENMNFPTPGGTGYYIFSGNNLTFRNCHINGGGLLIQGDNITIEHCTIEGGVSLSGTNGVTFRYNNVQNFSGDGIHLTSDSGQAANVTISSSYIHSPQPSCGDHADGIQIRGVNTLALTNNNFDMGPWGQVCGQDALNAAIFFESANGGNSNLTVDGNYLNGAGITLRLNPGSNQKIINNRFGRDYHYSVVNNQTNGGDITQQSGNVMDDNSSPVNF